MGADVLALMVEQHSPVLLWLTSCMSAGAVMLAFVLLPWLLAWWPLKRLGRALGRGYTRKWLSELIGSVYHGLGVYTAGKGIDRIEFCGLGCGCDAVAVVMGAAGNGFKQPVA